MLFSSFVLMIASMRREIPNEIYGDENKMSGDLSWHKVNGFDEMPSTVIVEETSFEIRKKI